MSTRNTTDATAAEVAIVDEKIGLEHLDAPQPAVGGHGEHRAEDEPTGTVKSTYWTLCHRPSRNSEPVSTSRYCSQPT